MAYAFLCVPVMQYIRCCGVEGVACETRGVCPCLMVITIFQRVLTWTATLGMLHLSNLGEHGEGDKDEDGDNHEDRILPVPKINS